MVIHDLPGFINAALKLAATPTSIKAGLLFIDFFSYTGDVSTN
jgi:hypothetical protein